MYVLAKVVLFFDSLQKRKKKKGGLEKTNLKETFHMERAKGRGQNLKSLVVSFVEVTF